jgi:hypothetical protein
MLSVNIRREFFRSTARVNAGSKWQKACVTLDMCDRSSRVENIVHSKDAKVILRKKEVKGC